MVVNSLWIGNTLSAMELLSIRSFISHGFAFHLWTYDTIENIPTDVVIQDANTILPKSSIFRYQNINKFGHGKGSVSGFSDLFRYKLLYDVGGIWTDMDITCLQSFSINEPYFFRYHHQLGLVGNFMKAPIHSELMWYCYQQTLAKVNEQNTDWLLPITILIDGVKKYNLNDYTYDISNKDSFPIVRNLFLSNAYFSNNWKIIHWMNEEWRRFSVNKNYAVKYSFFHQQLEKNNIPHQILDIKSALKLRFRTSSFSYSIINLKARLLWLFHYFIK